MSLIAYFPLNGNINNQCGSKYNATSSSAAYSSGKVTPQAMSFNGNQLYFDNPFIGLSKWSLSFWYKANSPNIWSDIFTFSDNLERIEFTSANGASLVWYNQSNGTSEVLTSGTNIASGLSNSTWYHIVVTFDNGVTSVFLNGEQKTQQTGKSGFGNTASRLYFASRIDGGWAYVDINDIKCYDHCLSIQEINDLSKGLVLQYGFGNAKPNLLSNGYQNVTSDAYGFASIGLGTGFLKNNTTYTLTICGYTSQVANKDSYLRVYVYDAGWSYQTWQLPIYSEKESLHTITFTTGSNAQNYNYVITAYHFPSGSAGQGNTSTIKWYKLEEGSVSTAYTDNTSYTYVFDNSGHGHTATSVGCSIATESKLGNSSLDTVPNSYVQLPNIHLDNSFTICGWVKHVGSFAGWARIFDFGTAANGADYSIGLATSDANGVICLFGRTGSGAALPDSYIETWSINTWYHYAITVNGTAINYYVNGELRYSFTANAPVGGRTYTLNYLAKSNWADPYSRKYMSDFRIYNTVLSQQEIVELYKNKAIIDNSYNIHSHEFIESSSHSINEVGEITACEFVEQDQYNKGLDAQYEMLEYIETTGTQYIDTGVTGTNTSYWHDIEFKNTGVRQLFGFDGNTGSYWGVQADGNFEMEGTTGINAHSRHVVEYSTGSSLYIDNTLVKTSTLSVINNGYRLFNLNVGGHGCSAYLYRFKAKQNGKLIRDMTPARRKSDNAVGMYDVVNNIFYTNSGSGTFGAGAKVDIGVSIVNAEYEQLEYLESTGAQQINTGLQFNMTTDSCLVDFQSTTTNQNGMIFASAQGTNHFWFYHYKDSGRIDLYINNSGAQIHVGGQAIDTKRHVMTYNKKCYFLDYNQYGYDNRVLNNTDYNMYLFSWGNNYYYSGRIYRCKIWKNGILTRNFIPAKRKTDGVLGMLDKITGQFLTNSGSGAFRAGASVGDIITIKANELKEDL